MKKNLISSAIAVILFTVLLGVGYPLVMTGIAQVAFPGRADGSPIKRDGKVVGSRLLAQAWTVPVLDASGKPKKDSDGNPVTAPDPKFFQPRPSQTGYKPERDVLLQPRAEPVQREVLLPRPARGVHWPRGQVHARPEETPTSPRTPSRRPARVSTRTSPRTTRASRRTASPPCASSALHGPEAHRREHGRRSLGILGEPGVNTSTLNEALDR